MHPSVLESIQYLGHFCGQCEAMFKNVAFRIRQTRFSNPITTIYLLCDLRSLKLSEPQPPHLQNKNNVHSMDLL